MTIRGLSKQPWEIYANPGLEMHYPKSSSPPLFILQDLKLTALPLMFD